MAIFKQDIRAYMTYGWDDERRVEIVSLSLTFGIQELPAAIVQVAVGKDTFDGRDQPNIPDSPDPDVPAKLFVTLRGQKNDAGEQWDGQPKLVFDGFISSLAATRLSNKSAGNLTIRHKLSNLMSSSMIASYAAPGSSAELLLPAYRRFENKSGATGPVSSGDLRGMLQEDIYSISSFNPDETDIWSDISKPFLVRVSEQNQFSSLVDFSSCFPNAGGDNVHALAALATIEGGNEDEPYYLAPDIHGASLRLPVGVSLEIVDAIKGDLTAPKVANLLQHTAWAYMIRHLHSSYSIGVIPGIHRSRVVPMVPTLAEPYITLNVNDVQVNDRNRPIDHPLLATTMSAGTLSTSGVGRPREAIGESFGFGPCFSPPQASPKGQIRHIPPPAWLRKAVFQSFSPDTTIQTIDGVGMGVFAADKDEASFGSQIDADQKNAEKASTTRFSIEDYGYRYVKAMYAQEMTSSRSLKLVSHLRFDVGPGSQVRVVSDSDIPVFGNVAYGMVARVTIAVDVSRPFAATSFQLSHVRSEKENAVEYLGQDAHPLFRNVFRGSPIDSPIP